MYLNKHGFEGLSDGIGRKEVYVFVCVVPMYAQIGGKGISPPQYRFVVIVDARRRGGEQSM